MEFDPFWLISLIYQENCYAHYWYNSKDNVCSYTGGMHGNLVKTLRNVGNIYMGNRNVFVSIISLCLTSLILFVYEKCGTDKALKISCGFHNSCLAFCTQSPGYNENPWSFTFLMISHMWSFTCSHIHKHTLL